MSLSLDGAHDVIQVTALSHDGVALRCACGKDIVATSREKATADHLTHYGLAMARAALEKARTG